MAKKATNIKKGIGAEAAQKALKKKFGDGIIVSGQSIADTEKMVIPFSPAHDLMLGGGIGEGTWTIVTGPAKVGKTTSALDFAGTAQSPEYDSPDSGPRKVFFFNIEGRLKGRDLRGIKTLTLSEDRFEVVKSKKGKILNAADYLECAETYINEVPGCVIVFDSFSQLCSKERQDAAIGDRFRDDTPILLSNFCKRMCNVLPVNDVVFIGITHLISNQTPGSMKQSSEAGGRKIQYNSDIKMHATHRTLYPKETEGTAKGQIIHWKCDWAASGAPGGKCESLLRYNHGIDKEWELIKIAGDLGIVNVAGSWLTFPDGSKCQGRDKGAQMLRDCPKVFKSIQKDCREMLGMPC
jgi:recombination protein RecA